MKTDPHADPLLNYLARIVDALEARNEAAALERERREKQLDELLGELRPLLRAAMPPRTCPDCLEELGAACGRCGCPLKGPIT
jgi:hypothetical protein